MRYVGPTVMRSATATNGEHSVNRRVLPIELPIVWTIRIHQALLGGRLIGARLAPPSPQCLRQRLRVQVHRQRCGWISETARLRRGGYVRLRQPSGPESVDHAARVDRHIV